MNPISAMLSGLVTTPPSEEALNASAKRAEEWQAKEAKRLHDRRVKESGIPEAYQAANLDHFPQLRGYTARFGPRSKPDYSILLYGKAGCGKTWTACGVGMELVDECLVRFVTAPGYVREMRDAMRSGDMEAVRFHYANCRLLILDDLGKGNPTDWSTGELWELLNDRTGKPTVVTTQYDERGLYERLAEGSDKESAEAIVSRVYSMRKVCPGTVDRRRS